MATLAINKRFLNFTLTMLTLAVLFGVAAVQPEKAFAADTVGVVDVLYLINNHPDTPKANEALQAEQAKIKQEFDAKAATLGDQEKQDLNRQMLQRMEQKRLELLKPIADKISAVIKDVSAQKGLTVIIAKPSVVLGGVDITEDVQKRITGK
jgi:outer membrane protein